MNNSDADGITTVTTDAEGIAQAVVLAGNVATSVRVFMVLEVDGVDVTTVSDKLVVTTGLPDQNSFSLSVEIDGADGGHNNTGGSFDGIEITNTIRMADKFNNPVPNGTAP